MRHDPTFTVEVEFATGDVLRSEQYVETKARQMWDRFDKMIRQMADPDPLPKNYEDPGTAIIKQVALFGKVNRNSPTILLKATMLVGGRIRFTDKGEAPDRRTSDDLAADPV